VEERAAAVDPRISIFSCFFLIDLQRRSLILGNWAGSNSCKSIKKFFLRKKQSPNLR
jgi:hypothetical protein